MTCKVSHWEKSELPWPENEFEDPFEEDFKICPICGTEWDHDYNVCPACGNSLEDEDYGY